VVVPPLELLAPFTAMESERMDLRGGVTGSVLMRPAPFTRALITAWMSDLSLSRVRGREVVCWAVEVRCVRRVAIVSWGYLGSILRMLGIPSQKNKKGKEDVFKAQGGEGEKSSPLQ
jgi:hypothetical protein